MSMLLNCSYSPLVTHPHLHSYPTRRSSDLTRAAAGWINNDVRQLPVQLLGDFVTERFLAFDPIRLFQRGKIEPTLDRKSTRLNSSHRCISYAVFCLKKKKNKSTD